MKSFELITLGEVALDVILLGVDRVPKRWSILGRTKAADIFTAGSAGYVAQCFAKLGGRAAVVGKIGDDNAGRFILKGFKQAGVSARHLRVEVTDTVLAGAHPDGEIAAANDAGAISVRVRKGNSKLEKASTSQPKYEISKLSEIIELIQRL